MRSCEGKGASCFGCLANKNKNTFIYMGYCHINFINNNIAKSFLSEKFYLCFLDNITVHIDAL